MVLIVLKLFRRIWITYIDHFVLRMFGFGGRWPLTLRNRGRSKKTEGQTSPKKQGLQFGIGYLPLKRQCPPPHLLQGPITPGS